MNRTRLFRFAALAALVAVSSPAFGATFLSLSSATYSVRENGSNAVISVLRAGNPHAKATVNFAASNGSATAGLDYTATSGTLTFNPGQRLKTFSVPILDDLLTESNETINLTLSSPSGGGTLRSPKTAVLTIIDNDGSTIPNVSIDNIAANEGNSGTTPFVFHLNLSPSSATTVTVDYATADGSALAGSDYVAQSGTLVFSPGESNKIITVLVNGNTINEPDKVFFVNLTASTNATVAPAQGIGTIINDDGPMVADDAYTTPEDTTLTVVAPGVLGNDSDVAGNPMTTELATDVAHGTLTLNADGSFTYTPNANFIGSDSFQYQAYDGVADSEIATVTITVQHVNRAPVANPDSFDTAPETALNVGAPGVLTNDTDFENDALTAVLVTGASNGSVTLNADGSFDYTPAASFTGLDTFTYAANDGQTDSVPATVSIYVDASNHVPVANNNSYATAVNTPLNIAAPGVLGNDTDADGNPLTALQFTGVSHGAVTLNLNGSFNYTPLAGYNGLDTFTYRASDGTATSSVAIVSIAVGAFNTAPVASNDNYTVAEDDTLTVNVATGLLANDTDAQSNPLTVALVTGPVHGALTLHADGSFTYLPDANFNGTDTFTYRATDGALASNLGTVTITVTPVSGAGDVDLYAKSAAFTVNLVKTNADRFTIKGKLNPRGAKADLTGAILQVSLNGTAIFAPVKLNNLGVAAVATGTTKVVTKVSSVTGLYAFTASGVDLSSIIGATNTATTVVHVTLAINGAGLDLPVLSGDLEMPVTTVAGKSSKGKFSFKLHRTLTGAFNWNKTTAVQLKDGTFKVTGSGVIEAEGGNHLLPTGVPRVTIGGDVLTLPATNLVWSLVDAAHTFKISATELSATGIPGASGGAPVSCQLPVMFEIPTADGTNIFETIIELKRPVGTSTKWKR